MTILPVGAELFYEDTEMDRRTDMTKLMVACCNFAIAPKTSESVFRKLHVYRMTVPYNMSLFL